MIQEKLSLRILCLRVLSAGVITFERFAVTFWRAMAVAAFVFAVWLFQIPAIFGGFGEGFALLCFFGGVGYFLWRDGSGFEWPSLRDIDRRIERDSDVIGRPLSGGDDALANPDKKTARELWIRARARLVALIPTLRPARMQSVMAARDPYAIRLLAVLVLGIGLVTAGPEWSARIWAGVMPFSVQGPSSVGAQARYTLWITPPEYTGAPQLILGENTMKDVLVEVREGSTIKAVVNGGFGTPRLVVGEDERDFTASGDSYAMEADLPEDGVGRLVLKQGLFSLAGWDFAVIADEAPTLSKPLDAVSILENGGVHFPLQVADDYGVAYLDMQMMLDPIVLPEDAPLGEMVEERRSVLSPAGEDFDIAPVYDLTAHYWAGLPVVFSFTASDKGGNESEVLKLPVILPERAFSHPVAKTLATLRKKLIWQADDPITYREISYNLRVLLGAQDLFHNDAVVYLGIRVAASRLHYNEPSLEISRSVIALLWDTALRVEDGELSLAARRLRDAQMALEEALQKPEVSDAEIASLMHDLRAAMAEYMNELAREMQKRIANGEPVPMTSPEMLSQMISPDLLSDFLAQMEAEMLSGNKDAAQEMLAQMQRMMDMLGGAGASGGQMPQDMQMMQEGINELKALIERQEDLLAQTRDQARILDVLNDLMLGNLDYGQSLARDGSLLEQWGLGDLPPQPSAEERATVEQSAPPEVNTQENRTEQEALRIILGQLMLEAGEALPEIPPGLGLAEQEMRGSSEALGLNVPGDSIPHQELALAFLQDSQDELSQQFMQRMQQMIGFSMSAGGGGRYDPLGRPMGGDEDPNGEGSGSNVQIPDDAERRHVQEILRVLRERAGQYDRPRDEIEYYRRLLKRF